MDQGVAVRKWRSRDAARIFLRILLFFISFNHLIIVLSRIRSLARVYSANFKCGMQPSVQSLTALHSKRFSLLAFSHFRIRREARIRDHQYHWQEHQREIGNKLLALCARPPRLIQPGTWLVRLTVRLHSFVSSSLFASLSSPN